MTVVEMHQWFDQIEDKVDSIYFTEAEKDNFINRAIQIFINDIIHKFRKDPQGELVISSKLEESMNVSEVLQPLMLIDLPVEADTNGLISTAEIDVAINLRSNEEESSLHTLNLAYIVDGEIDSETGALTAGTVGDSVNYVRENDYYKFLLNDFKQPTDAERIFRIGSEGLYIRPVQDAAEVYLVSVIKAPKPVNYDTLSSTDLPETSHDYIMASALYLAGFPSKDEALIRIKEGL